MQNNANFGGLFYEEVEMSGLLAIVRVYCLTQRFLNNQKKTSIHTTNNAERNEGQ